MTLGFEAAFLAVTGRWNLAMTSCRCGSANSIKVKRRPHLLRVHAPVKPAELDALRFERSGNDVQEGRELREHQRLVGCVKRFEVLDELFNLGRAEGRLVGASLGLDKRLLLWGQLEQRGQGEAMSAVRALGFAAEPIFDALVAVSSQLELGTDFHHDVQQCPQSVIRGFFIGASKQI